MKLLISLGHNSSAVLVDKHNVLCGYEEERLSKVKSDSSYPKLAIEEILKYHPEASTYVTEIHVSHWFWLDGNEMKESKYWQPKHIAARFKNATVHSVNSEFTHHDAHASSVWNFSETTEGFTLVADGFGNNGETVSIYENGFLIERNYNVSLGLMYQFMTSHLGMKENQDEYKMLGLESHVTGCTKLDIIAKGMLDIFVSHYYFSAEVHSVNTLIKYNNQIFSEILEGTEDLNRNEKAYCIQKFLEEAVLELIEEHYSGQRIMQFSGGIFYNVKLNNVILNKYADVVDRIEFMPLAGDQGASLGMVPLVIKNLFWGKREADYIKLVREGMWFCMKGNMEFGPRALGNTSCIAFPTEEMTQLINDMNGRPNIMPMAPMISSDLASKYCKNVEKLGKCKHYMICATDWLGPIEQYRGVLHRKPCSEVYTCRPQVVDNDFTKLLGVVINTSLNAHGQPILLDMRDYDKMEEIHEQNHSNS